MTTKRRYEILLPVLDNAGNIQPAANFEAAEKYLLDTFGGFTNCGKVRGEWQGGDGITYRDELIKVAVDVDDTRQNQDFVRWFKSTLEHDFAQKSIYVTSYLIEVL